MQLGIVSSVCCSLPALEIVPLAEKIQASVIEWSAVTHPEVLEPAVAESLRTACSRGGIQSVSLDVDYCLGTGNNTEKDMERLLNLASIYGAQNITVRAGGGSSRTASDEELSSFLRDVRTAAAMAEEQGCHLSISYQEDSFMDNYITVLGFFARMGRTNIRLSWQPNRTTSLIYNIYELKMIAKYIHNVHAYCRSAQAEACPLAEGRDEWMQYLKVLAGKPGNVLLARLGPQETWPALETDYMLLSDLMERSGQ